MASCSTSMYLVGILAILQVLWSEKLYVNGCYPSIISFGDSLADTGNLKQIAAMTNRHFLFFSPPYGQNFFNQSTGRCSNGRLIIDFLAESLGLPLIPPYIHEKGSGAVKFGQGVNYAVAGATALDLAFLESKGIHNYVTNASLGVQLSWFQQSLPTICANASDCKNLIGRSLILMGEIGGNDYNYPLSTGKPVVEIEPLVPFVIDSIVSAIYELIEKGAVTIVVPGNFPIGCLAAYLTIYGSETEEYDPETGCLIGLNKFAEYHNEFLQTKLNYIRQLHPNVNIIYADYYNAGLQIYRSPNKYGFTNGLKACCGTGGPFNFNLFAQCGSALATMCDQPDTYISWDGFHLTEAAYRVIHDDLFRGPFTTPRFSSLCPTPTLQLRVGLSSIELAA